MDDKEEVDRQSTEQSSEQSNEQASADVQDAKELNEEESINKNKQKEELIIKDPDEGLNEQELADKLFRSTKLKEEGNLHFKNEEFVKSLDLYSQALGECPFRFKDKRSIILNNKAVCKWKLLERSNDNSLDFKDEKIKAEFDEIINDLNCAIELNSTYFKPYLKRAELNHRFGGDKLDNALDDYKKLLNELISDDNRKLKDEIKYEIAKLEKEIEQRNEKLKQEMFGQLKNLGNLILNPFGLSTDNFRLEQNDAGGYSVKFEQQQQQQQKQQE